MTRRQFAPGTRVVSRMGCRTTGTVSAERWHRRDCTDGTYREPERHESPVYIRWDDGSRGWAHSAILAPEGSDE